MRNEPNAKLNERRRRILVVEDEVLVRLAVAEELRDRGIQVIEASSADEAWTFLSGGEADLVFTDIQMPGSMDGLELASRIGHSFPTIAVVVTSGHVRAGAYEGIGRFIAKPYPAEDVADRLIALLDQIQP